jgi:TPP-dependent pyruvate/acetoin dehydrogenase alpha subunit
MQFNETFLSTAYQQMAMIRAFEERVNVEMGTGEIPGAVHLYAGQEASAVGICMHLSDKDRIASTHRGHGHCIAKGCDINAMMAEIYGRSSGTCRGRGGSMHIADLEKGMLGANGIVGGGPPIACGAALTAKYRRTGGVAVSFSGDGAINQGTTAESMNLAKVWNLPMIFAVEDNGFGEASASDWAVAGDVLKRAESYDIPSARIDGTDVLAVYTTAGEAITRARNGGGPSLLHILVPRYYGHFSGDSDTYRTRDEKESMRRDRDCLKIFRKRVLGDGSMTEQQLAAIDAKVNKSVDEAVKFARAAARPDPRNVAADVYVSYV